MPCSIVRLATSRIPRCHGAKATARSPRIETRSSGRLKGVRLGDVLRLKTPHGDFDYRVSETLIVKPEDVWVLDPTPVTTLTLISCWPFNYIGHAPERFIVRAERIPTVSVATNRTE